MTEVKKIIYAVKSIKTEEVVLPAVCIFHRVSTHCMKRKYIGERSDGFDVVASKVHFDRLKKHRNKRLLVLFV